MLAGILGVGHWLFYGFGWMPHYSGVFHSSIQMQVYMSCFVIGFLTTAMPRFTGARPSSFGEFLFFLSLEIAMIAALCLGQRVWAYAGFVLILVALGRFAVVRATRRKKTNILPPIEFVWIPVAILNGITGSLLMIASSLHKIPMTYAKVGKPMLEQGFILSIVLGVGGFLAPRMMGTFRAPIKPESNGQFSADSLAKMKRLMSAHFILSVLFFSSFWIEGLLHQKAAFFLRAAIITVEFFWTCSFLCFPKTSEDHARILWISLWMVVIGSWLAAFFPVYRVVLMHFVFIGGLSLMVFAVATMVIFSHSGEVKLLQLPSKPLRLILGALVLSVLLRWLAHYFPEHYFSMLSLAALGWITASIGWFVYIRGKILKMSHGDEIEHHHQEAKERILKMKNLGTSSHVNCGGSETCGS